MASRDPATDQLLNYREKAKSSKQVGKLNTTATTSSGAPLMNQDSSLTVGPRGPIPISDVQFVEEVAHFVRERIPERVLHAKGAGAYGFFEATADISHLTVAKVFHLGKRTPVAVRFSTTAGELGSHEGTRDMKGMSVKFQTEDGILDLAGNHVPTFFIRDPILFPSMVHAFKRNPKTNLYDPNMVWDFFSLRPETMNTVLQLYSATGIPDGWRRMNSYPVNVYKMVNFYQQIHYCRFSFQCNETKRHLSSKQAAQVESDYFTRDLYNAIEKHNYPSWSLNIQVMTERQATEMLTRPVNPFDPFDATKNWSKLEIPFIRIGTLTLSTNPTNYFAEIEQLAFSPANMVPGLEASAYDKILQGRIFAYPDAQRYRLGANYQQLTPNRSIRQVSNYQRNGPQTLYSQGEQPHYHPNTFEGPKSFIVPRIDFKKDIFLAFPSNVYDDEWQSRQMLQMMDILQKKELAGNIAESLAMVTVPDVTRRMLDRFAKIDNTLYRLIKESF